MKRKILVIGGVAGGATAIARLRRLDENAEIILFEKGEYVSFANCGLPYYIGGVIKERDNLFVSDIKSIEGKYGVEIRNFSEVVAIDKENKKIKVKEVNTGKEYEESYDKLLVSTGSTPFVPPMDGVNSDNVFTLWNIPDTDKVYNYIKANNPKKALVVGGGFIGLEMAENLHEKGLEVTLAEFAPQVMAPLDKDMAKLVENELIDKGINLLLETGAKSILENGKKVELTSGEIIDTDIILLAVGVRPNSGILKDAGVEVTERGHVVVDEYMQTSDENIYAVGDIVEITNPITGLKGAIPLAGPANKQGRVVAANILGLEKEKYFGTIGTSVAKVMDLTVASTGENEKSLQRQGLKLWKDYGIALIHPMSHASYYPGAVSMTIKLIFSMKDGKIFGAQIVGYDGVDKRIDTVATSIHFNGTVNDLTEIELAYAPPFSSAKDPINMAGYVAQNILTGKSSPILYRELEENPEFVLLDVREEVETFQGKIENSINIPLTQIRNRLDELDKEKTYIAQCAVGLRGYIAEQILKQNGFKVRNLAGGFRSYMDMQDRKKTPKVEIKMDQDKFEEVSKNDDVEEVFLDVCGLSCPGPIVKVSQKMGEIDEGTNLKVTATDPGFARDIEAWANNTGNKLVDLTSGKGTYTALLQKGNVKPVCEISDNSCVTPNTKEKTMIVFDGDLDKAIASFIIATGSAAMGNKVNMFFTFWGLSILRKENAPKVEKGFIEKMFSIMLPKGSKKLGLSKMNFGGMGSKMMRMVMEKKGVTSLEELIKQAQDAGVKMIACQMSMDVMGITKEELIDGVEIGGVATMLADNDRSNMNLFI